jgi:lipopolysaccharide export system permease protein
MQLNKRLIERYLVGAVVPYVALAMFLLTTLLLLQQSSRFAETLFGTGLPFATLSEVTLWLLPAVVAFTLPMAMLTGTLIGFSRMGSDSELVALRAAGVGIWKMVWPVLFIGLILSLLSLYINLEIAPDAARSLKLTGLRAALYKLDSPVEPRSFNTDIPGYVVYVRDGDKVSGQWGRVFIYSQDKDGSTRLITARSGRIDSSGDKSELVLNDAVATKLPANHRGESNDDMLVVERLAQTRVQFDTGRSALLKKLRKDDREVDLDEMKWQELLDYASSKRDQSAGFEAATLFHKRLALSLAPLVLARRFNCAHMLKNTRLKKAAAAS